MDIKNIFFQTNVDDDAAPAQEGGGFRSRVEAPCPGNRENLVTLAKGEYCLDFLKRGLRNVGTCKIWIVLYEQKGTALGAYDIEPGAYLNTDGNPPSNTYIIKLGCDLTCGGKAILEFDKLYA